MKQNYQRQLEEILCRYESQEPKPSLLLHACCAPCSSYVLEYLASRFCITLFFYNPNIFPESEYRFREQELCRLVQDMNLTSQVRTLLAEYHPEEFTAVAQGLESVPEGGARCAACYRLRLRAAAEAASRGQFDYFTTTLSISPYKNAEWLNTIGQEEAERANVRWLPSDFKKKNGYKRSCELSAQYHLYRQNYCGCIHSQRAAEHRPS